MRKLLLSLAGSVLLAGTLTAGAQVFVRIGPPPPPVVEVMPPPPHPGWIWQPGYQRWDGVRYVWVPGAYVLPPRPGLRWIPGHWRPTPRGYVWIPGHWR